MDYTKNSIVNQHDWEEIQQAQCQDQGQTATWGGKEDKNFANRQNNRDQEKGSSGKRFEYAKSRTSFRSNLFPGNFFSSS